jgi:hypothetical protein
LEERTGELAAAMQYSVQGLNCEDPGRKDLLMDIGTEELGHLEIVATLARMPLKSLKSVREEAEADPLIAILHPALHMVWSALWGTPALLVTLDRCRFTPPWREGENPPLSLHWDHDPLDTSLRWIQGVVALRDSPAGAGGFRCVPTLYRTPSWIGARTNPERLRRQPDLRRGVREPHQVVSAT